MIKIALAGNPNCGKTTMFNALTGASQYVGNWPGVTVEKKEGKLKGNKNVTITDLPGIYSLSPYTPEEVVARNYLIDERPDAIINIVDASNIERNLYLTMQILETGIPVVVALNMMDIIEKLGDRIDSKKLGESLGCDVFEVSALKERGLDAVTKRAQEIANRKKVSAIKHTFGKQVESALSEIENILEKSGQVEKTQMRWYSVKAFENDEKALNNLILSQNITSEIKAIVDKCENEMDDDSESIITNERYMYIGGIIKKAVKKTNLTNTTISDKIDKIVTNRYLALPIFAVIMWFVYYISVSSAGTIFTDWANDGVFGDGWNLFGIEGIWIPGIPIFIENVLSALHCAEWLQSFVLDGIVGGVGAVLGFLPQMIILFFLLALLEDCGYMARIAFIMDRIFRRFGLSGKSFIPILVGTGCGVPGVMASRTIENEKDRKMTVMVTTFIPCGAKLPIIALIAGALFPDSAWVAPSAYFLGIAAIIISGIILKKTKLFAGDPAPFVMELPAYHMPGIKGVFIHMWDRAKSFVKKAGTIIFIACALIWFLSSFSWKMQMVEETESMLADIGRVIAPIFTPIGFGDWRAAVATITGLVAKENVVGTFGVLYGAGEVAEDGAEIWTNLQASFTVVSAYAFLAFNLLCAPCFAAIGAIKREMGSWKWTGIAICYQCLLAYAAAFIIYHLGSMIFLGTGITIGAVIAVIVIAAIMYLLFRKGHSKNYIKGGLRA